ncbi:MAG: ABC transporter ATP-binding protein [Chloroflexi bacterium]|nr:ABC transporter ATP-binding protein [Chloroflexota bacterium]
MTQDKDQPAIRVEKLTKDYVMGANTVHAVRGVDLTVTRGELVAIMGPSGSGKSTFLNLLGCLDRPTAGQYWLDGIAVSRLSSGQLATVRNRKIGFVFQMFHLLPRATALENVTLPLLYAGVVGAAARERGLLALAAVGLAERAGHLPSELSGGQHQRVAIARSLVTGPALILADEPTGNLDTRMSIEVMAILQELNDDGITIVLVTHEPDIAAYCGRVVSFQDGTVIEDTACRNPKRAEETLARLAPEEVA